MSADNWTSCPKCAYLRREHEEKEALKVKESYGTVPVEEFDKLRSDLEELISLPPSETFREDYEIFGAEDGTVVVEYRGHCNICSAHLEFTYERDIDFKEKA